MSDIVVVVEETPNITVETESSVTIEVGDSGARGPQGLPGPSGYTPIKGVDYFDGIDGAVGPSGPMGLQGPQGIQGIQGIPGASGMVGEQGLSVLSAPADPTTSDGVDGDFFINTNTLVLFGPKVTNNWGPGTTLIGPPGPQGLQGETGPAIPVGIVFSGVWDSSTPYDIGAWIGYNNSTFVAIQASTNQNPATASGYWYELVINAPQGPIGPEGPVGPEGPQGIQGFDGADGAIGPQGPVGPSGAIGEMGPMGIQGLQGEMGPSGLMGLTGPQGPQGDKGDTGETGPSILNYRLDWDSGATYEPNDWVAFMATGETFARGWFALVENTNVPPDSDPAVWAQLSVSGPTGPVGPSGVIGPSGATGPQGPQGIQGIQGPQGIQGLTGATGPQGPQGIQGVAGPAGPSGGGALSGKLSANMSSGALTCSVTINGEWPRVPEDVTSFNILIDSELMTVTSRTATVGGVSTFTVQRARFGTVATSHNKNTVVNLRMLVGAVGPNSVTTSTGTTISGILFGNDINVGSLVVGSGLVLDNNILSVASGGASTTKVLDTFSRADSNIVGMPQVGDMPVTFSYPGDIDTGSWGISSNKLAPLASKDENAILWDTGTTRYIFTATMVIKPIDGGLLFRGGAGGQWAMIHANTGSKYTLYVRSGTNYQLLLTGTTQTPTNGDVIQIHNSGTYFKLIVNGVVEMQSPWTGYGFQTYIGFREHNATVARFTNMSVVEF